jgi:N-acetylglucosaminyldiphosphoundecaprenol N-acetyl-beta-D-mannosaminyltransferase
MTSDTIEILNYKLYSGNLKKLSEIKTGIISTINPHSYIVAIKDVLFRKALLESDFLLPDGIGIVLAAKILLNKKINKIAGSDLHLTVISALSKGGGKCFYLGSTEETLALIKKRLENDALSIKADFCSPPFTSQFSAEDNKMIINKINEFKPDVLFVGMTAPKQEKWVYQNRESLNVPLICSIGAVFDFYAGTVKRPGQFWINLGLEWLPRLLKQPGKLWRRNFISNPLFMLIVFREKIKLIFATFFIKKRS